MKAQAILSLLLAILGAISAHSLTKRSLLPGSGRAHPGHHHHQPQRHRQAQGRRQGGRARAGARRAARDGDHHHEEARAIATGYLPAAADDYEYDDLEDNEPQVTKRPTVDFASFSRQNNLTSGSALPQDIQCSLVTSLEERCAAFSLLEGWKLDPDLVAFASQEEILMAINSLQRSPVYGHDTDFTALLGGIVRNTTGHIVAASTAR